ncbi:OsmC family protein [Streptomyces adustus]|uniref:OsmC family protein n=1 Tax=Streptomyces adustus TaxID=1609272 RepID=UPI0035E0DA59
MLLAALGACTSMTTRRYTGRHARPLRGVQVRLRREQDGEPAIVREIHLDGDLDDDQRRRLMAVAERCPVHRLLRALPPLTTVQVKQPVAAYERRPLASKAAPGVAGPPTGTPGPQERHGGRCPSSRSFSSGTRRQPGTAPAATTPGTTIPT